MTLDPQDWPAFRVRAHKMLDQALDHMQGNADRPVWRQPPEMLRNDLTAPLPRKGRPADDIDADLTALLPYGVGNTHPRFFGWVHGSGTPANLMAEITAAALNANVGGRDHAAIYVERQLTAWMAEMFGFPPDASGLTVSGTSFATLIALKVARDRATGFGVDTAAGLVGYTSAQAHSCVARTFDILGLGGDALRKVPVTKTFQIDINALQDQIAADRAAGLTPFCIVGTAGAVNMGAIDDLDALADIAKAQTLWLHIDGAFGATAIISKRIAPLLKGIARADSIAFDFHKWLHVNYDAGFVLIRDAESHKRAFSDRAEYLAPATRGLAAGGDWPTDFGPELSRGFRALKVWAQLAEFGTDRLAAQIDRNCDQAARLGALVADDPQMELLAPVTLNICCFRFAPPGAPDLDALNEEIVIRLQETGLAAPSTTTIHGKLAIRVNITNHRTRDADIDALLDGVRRIGAALI